MQVVFPSSSSKNNNTYLISVGYWDWSFRATPMSMANKNKTAASTTASSTATTTIDSTNRITLSPTPLHSVRSKIK